MVAILDADKEGFLRSETSLVQTIGRCARNVNAQVLLYADEVTPSMRRAIDETNRRRTIQQKYNEEHGITPATIRKAIRTGLEAEVSARRTVREMVRLSEEQYDQQELICMLERQMLEAAEALEFERAAELRDRIRQLKQEPSLVPVQGVTTAGKTPTSSGATSGPDTPWQPRSKKRHRARRTPSS